MDEVQLQAALAMAGEHDDDIGGQFPPWQPPFFNNQQPAAPKALATCADFVQRNGTSSIQAEPNPQENSPFMVLHDELLSLVAGFLGPRCSVKDTTWTPSNLFAACRRLGEVGRQVSTRVEFLLGNYGQGLVVHGMGSWLGIVSLETLDAVFRRIQKCDVPRYQLQRLARRLILAQHFELHHALQLHLNELYPLIPWTGFRMDTLKGISDDELFRHIVTHARVPDEFGYLVRQGAAAGWSDPNDAVITALRTLRRKYHLPASVEPAGRSKLCRSLVTSSDDLHHAPLYLSRVPFDARPDPTKDAAVPGLDANHALLILKIQAGDQQAVRWLLDCEVATTIGRGTWFWDAVDAAKLRCTEEEASARAATRTAHLGIRDRIHEARGGVIAKILGVDDRDVFQRAGGVVEPQSTGTIAAHLCTRFSLSYIYRDQSRSIRQYALQPPEIPEYLLDAVLVATRAKRPGIVRLILEHEHEKGRWFTEEGRRTLQKCLELSQAHVEIHALVRNYCLDVGADRSVDLLAAFNTGDQNNAREMAAEGVTLSVGQMAALLRQPTVPRAIKQLAINLIKLPLRKLESLLKSLTQDCRHLAPHNNGVEHVHISDLLEGHRALWAQHRGQAVLASLFSPKLYGMTCARASIRPYLGPTAGLPLESPILEWDLLQGVLRNDIALVNSILDRGFRLSTNSFHSLFYRGPRTPPAQDALIAVFDKHSIPVEDLRRVLEASLLDGLFAFATHLLSSPSAEKLRVGPDTVLTCFSRLTSRLGGPEGQPGIPPLPAKTAMFGVILARGILNARQSTAMLSSDLLKREFDIWNAIREKVNRQGPAWIAVWNQHDGSDVFEVLKAEGLKRKAEEEVEAGSSS